MQHLLKVGAFPALIDNALRASNGDGLNASFALRKQNCKVTSRDPLEEDSRALKGEGHVSKKVSAEDPQMTKLSLSESARDMDLESAANNKYQVDLLDYSRHRVQ